MYYNWSDILKSKTDDELVKIFNDDAGYSHQARISAAKILLERDYDKEKLQSIKDRYLEKLNAEINEIQSTDIRKETRGNTISAISLALIWCIFPFFTLNLTNTAETFTRTYLVIYVAMVTILIVFAVKRIRGFKKNLVKELEENLKSKQKTKETLNLEVQI